MKSLRYLIPVALFFGILVFLYIGLGRDPQYVPSPLIGKPVPTFKLPLLTNTDKTFSSEDFKGKVSLVNVWASWCVSCRYEHQLLVDLANTTDVAIIGINYKDERADALQWLARLGNPYQATVFDYDGRVGIDWGVYGTPESFIVDTQGIIRYKHVGPLTAQDMQDKVMPMISELRQQSQSTGRS
jgi:cytochrome c biogenesis protein CcmG/thiol:disulfide interchange protein DsbE